MAETAGTKLRRARQMRQMSLEDAARATKIRAHQLADLEADEYSNFANLAYARSYLVNYGKFLRVDMRQHAAGFSDASSFGLDDYQYLSEKPVGVYRVPHRRSARARRPQRRQLLGAAMGMAALALGLVGWIVVVNIQRLGPLDTLADRQEAQKAARGNHMMPADTAPPGADESSTGERVPDGPAPVTVLPVSRPTGSVEGAATPAPTTTPATVPAQVSIPILANAVDPVAASPAPLMDDHQPTSEMLAAHANQTQKVVNDHPSGR